MSNVTIWTIWTISLMYCGQGMKIATQVEVKNM